MNAEKSSEKTSVPCPLCGAPAERGRVMGSSNQALRWFDGLPSFWKRFKAGSPIVSDPGDPVGAIGQYCSSFIEGIRCKTCDRIICDNASPNEEPG